MEPVQNGEWIQTEVGPDVYFCKINLLPGMGVEVRVAARNVNGVGNMSDEIVSAALPKPPEPPVEPTYLEVEDCSVLCRWTKPESIRMPERGNCLGGKGVNGAVILEYIMATWLFAPILHCLRTPPRTKAARANSQALDGAAKAMAM